MERQDRFRLVALVTIVGLAMAGLAAAQDSVKMSPEGYYEGSGIYSATYMKNISYMSMVLKSRSDFWFTLSPAGPGEYQIQGEGLSLFDFAFGVDWSMAVKASVSVLNVLGAKIDPKVTLTLDPQTAAQKFYLSGLVSPEPDGTRIKFKGIALSWLPPNAAKDAKPPKLRLQLVGSVSVDGTYQKSGDAKKDIPKVGEVKAGGDASLGGKSQGSTVMQTIEVDPLSPFGDTTFTLVLKPRSPYGPYADEFQYDGQGTNANTGVSARYTAVQKIDFRLIRKVYGEPEPVGSTRRR